MKLPTGMPCPIGSLPSVVLKFPKNTPANSYSLLFWQCRSTAVLQCRSVAARHVRHVYLKTNAFPELRIFKSCRYAKLPGTPLLPLHNLSFHKTSSQNASFSGRRLPRHKGSLQPNWGCGASCAHKYPTVDRNDIMLKQLYMCTVH